MSSTETLGPIFGFPEQLGSVLAELAEQAPDPDDESARRFIGPTASGGVGKWSCSPRQYAQAVIERTPFGEDIIEFYRKISENLGDPTGQMVIDDMRADMLGEDPSRLAARWQIRFALSEDPRSSSEAISNTQE